MGKFGKKVVVSKNMNDFMIGVMAPSGFGKTTLMYKTCDKLFGDEGYIICDLGNENGVAALEGAVAERVPTWKKFKEIVDDIVKNKETDYKDLKVVILDTLDAAFEIAEEFVVKAWNSENMGQQGFKPASSINSVEGGFGKGLERVIDTIKKEINRLDKVGVRCWWTAHVKEKDQTDLFTGNAYTTLTANMSMKYFNSIKNISHIIGFGYFDRTVEKQEIGEANVVTKKKKTRNAVLDESRKIKFRDDSMIADAKSRFSSIVDEVNLDVDEFIKAITDAIEAESKGTTPTTKKTKKKAEPTPVVEDPVVEEEEDLVDIKDDAPFDLDEEMDDIFDEDVVEEDAMITLDTKTLTAIRNAFKASEADVKAQVKEHLVDYGNKLSETMKSSDVVAIKKILGIK